LYVRVRKLIRSGRLRSVTQGRARLIPASAILLQRTDEEKVSKERMHVDLKTDDVATEVKRLETLGATRWDHQQERRFNFWVMRDLWDNEFRVLETESPEILAKREPWNP
jgi:predicted RNA-binding protein